MTYLGRVVNKSTASIPIIIAFGCRLLDSLPLLAFSYSPHPFQWLSKNSPMRRSASRHNRREKANAPAHEAKVCSNMCSIDNQARVQVPRSYEKSSPANSEQFVASNRGEKRRKRKQQTILLRLCDNGDVLQGSYNVYMMNELNDQLSALSHCTLRLSVLIDTFMMTVFVTTTDSQLRLFESSVACFITAR